MVLANLHSSSPEVSTKVISHRLLDVSAGESSQPLTGSDAPLLAAGSNSPQAQRCRAIKMK